MSEKTWDEVASEDPQEMSRIWLSKRGDRWRVTARKYWKYNGMTDVTKETEGRGDSPEEACEAVREDIFAWCEGNSLKRAEYATALRKLCYAAEDAE